jgi:hypothetical protein
VAIKPSMAREVNAHILALEAGLEVQGFLKRPPDRNRISLFCECGCGHTVELTRLEYEMNSGAWLEGHSRVAA